MTYVPDPAVARLLASGGEMGRMIAQRDWSGTDLGPPQGWPQSLRSAMSICLASRFPMLIFWGSRLSVLYNDTYVPMLGSKHPASLGQPADQVWSELWPVIGPMLRGVLSGGHATFSDDLELLINRHGYPEETYWTLSYSPILDEGGSVGGVFCAVNETTRRVLGERRLDVLRALGSGTDRARTVTQACRLAAASLSVHHRDLPFVLIYLVNEDDPSARLAGSSVLPPGGPMSPIAVPLDATSADRSDPSAPSPVWPLGWLLESSRSLDGSRSLEVELPVSGWHEAIGWQPAAPVRALILPLSQPTGDELAGFLVTGVNPRRRLDDDYRAFLDLVVDRISTLIAEAAAHQADRGRVEALAEIDRVKTEFYANVSHEFRTPLTLLLGPLEDLLSDLGLNATEHAHAEVAHRNALRLLKLVNTLLDFTRLEAGRMQAVYQPVDLAARTTDLVSAFRAAIDRAGLDLVVDCPPLPQPVHVDDDMWEKIVFNLLSNAFKFTESGAIRVTLRTEADHAVLSVADTGVGVPAEHLPRLFDRFHRVPDAQARTHEGTGIGLSLARELVILHGGGIEVTSVPGVGSTFRICLPFGTAHLPVDQLITEPAGGPSTRWLPDEPDRTSPATPGRTDANDGTEILVVDDNADMREYLRRLLAPYWRVSTARDGAEALRRIAVTRPDLVLTDVMMPRMDGFELVRRIRADRGTADLPVIVVTARAGQESTVDGIASGASDYLIKPFTAAELLARVRGQVNAARLRRAATDRLRRLIDVGAALSESFPTGETGRVLAEELITEAALWCAIWLVHRDLGGQDHLGLHLAAAASPDVAIALHDQPELPALLGVGDVIATGRPNVVGDEAASWPVSLQILTEHLVLTLPLTARGATFGAVTLAIDAEREADLRPYLEEVVRRGALVMDNARLFQNERRAALSLQRSLLPPRLPELTGAHAAARYLPGAQGVEAGGDWYDVIALADGRVGLTVGDVMGRGMQAAALMGQVRSGLRSYAMEGLEPAAVLQRLDTFLTGLDMPQLTTCLYATFDPRSGELRIASAGHPAPLVIRPRDSTAEYPTIKPGLPLGLDLGAVAAEELTLVLDPGTMLLMYTDGLVETHDESIDSRMERLRRAFLRPDVDLQTCCDIALAEMGHVVNDEVAAGHDDIALLALRRDG